MIYILLWWQIQIDIKLKSASIYNMGLLMNHRRENIMTEKTSDKVTITLRVEPATKEILDLISKVKGISTNEYLNQLITDKVSEVEPATLKEIEKLRNL
jgi:hypothetical protein